MFKKLYIGFIFFFSLNGMVVVMVPDETGLCIPCYYDATTGYIIPVAAYNYLVKQQYQSVPDGVQEPLQKTREWPKEKFESELHVLIDNLSQNKGIEIRKLSKLIRRRFAYLRGHVSREQLEDEQQETIFAFGSRDENLLPINTQARAQMVSKLAQALLNIAPTISNEIISGNFAATSYFYATQAEQSRKLLRGEVSHTRGLIKNANIWMEKIGHLKRVKEAKARKKQYEIEEQIYTEQPPVQEPTKDDFYDGCEIKAPTPITRSDGKFICGIVEDKPEPPKVEEKTIEPPKELSIAEQFRRLKKRWIKAKKRDATIVFNHLVLFADAKSKTSNDRKVIAEVCALVGRTYLYDKSITRDYTKGCAYLERAARLGAKEVGMDLVKGYYHQKNEAKLKSAIQTILDGDQDENKAIAYGYLIANHLRNDAQKKALECLQCAHDLFLGGSANLFHHVMHPDVLAWIVKHADKFRDRMEKAMDRYALESPDDISDASIPKAQVLYLIGCLLYECAAHDAELVIRKKQAIQLMGNGAVAGSKQARLFLATMPIPEIPPYKQFQFFALCCSASSKSFTTEEIELLDSGMMNHVKNGSLLCLVHIASQVMKHNKLNEWLDELYNEFPFIFIGSHDAVIFDKARKLKIYEKLKQCDHPAARALLSALDVTYVLDEENRDIMNHPVVQALLSAENDESKGLLTDSKKFAMVEEILGHAIERIQKDAQKSKPIAHILSCAQAAYATLKTEIFKSKKFYIKSEAKRDITQIECLFQVAIKSNALYPRYAYARYLLYCPHDPSVASDCVKTGLEIYKELLNEESEYTIIILFDLVNHYMSVREFKLAEHYLERARGHFKRYYVMPSMRKQLEKLEKVLKECKNSGAKKTSRSIKSYKARSRQAQVQEIRLKAKLVSGELVTGLLLSTDEMLKEETGWPMLCRTLKALQAIVGHFSKNDELWKKEPHLVIFTGMLISELYRRVYALQDGEHAQKQKSLIDGYLKKLKELSEPIQKYERELQLSLYQKETQRTEFIEKEQICSKYFCTVWVKHELEKIKEEPDLQKKEELLGALLASHSELKQCSRDGENINKYINCLLNSLEAKLPEFYERIKNYMSTSGFKVQYDDKKIKK